MSYSLTINSCKPQPQSCSNIRVCGPVIQQKPTIASRQVNNNGVYDAYRGWNEYYPLDVYQEVHSIDYVPVPYVSKSVEYHPVEKEQITYDYMPIHSAQIKSVEYQPVEKQQITYDYLPIHSAQIVNQPQPYYNSPYNQSNYTQNLRY